MAQNMVLHHFFIWACRRGGAEPHYICTPSDAAAPSGFPLQ